MEGGSRCFSHCVVLVVLADCSVGMRNWQYMGGRCLIKLDISFGCNKIVVVMDQCVDVKLEYASKSSTITLDVSRATYASLRSYVCRASQTKFNTVVVWNGQAVQGHDVDTRASVSFLPPTSKHKLSDAS